MKEETKLFLDHLNKDYVCLHLADTIPGLGFNPTKHLGYEHILKIKNRNPQKPFIGLTASLDKTMKFWQPLPSNWEKVLRKIWPAPLSVAWKAADNAPNTLVFEDNTISLRVPELPKENLWFMEVLEGIDFPFPTTSVNRSAEFPCVTWDEAVKFVRGMRDVYVPNLVSKRSQMTSSTLIKIMPDGNFSVIRNGPLSRSEIESIIQSCK